MSSPKASRKSKSPSRKSKSPSRKSKSPSRKTEVDIAEVRKELDTDSKSVKVFKMEKVIHVLLFVAIFFLALYISSGVFDDIYREDHRVTKSTVFICNTVSATLVIILMLIRYYNPVRTTSLFVIEFLLAGGVAASVIVAASKMKDLLEGELGHQSSEDTTQYVLSLLGIVFAGLCSLLIIINIFMARYA